MALRLPALAAAILFVGATGAWRTSARPVITATTGNATGLGSSVRLTVPATLDAIGPSTRGSESPFVLTLVGSGFALIARAVRRRERS